MFIPLAEHVRKIKKCGRRAKHKLSYALHVVSGKLFCERCYRNDVKINIALHRFSRSSNE